MRVLLLQVALSTMRIEPSLESLESLSRSGVDIVVSEGAEGGDKLSADGLAPSDASSVEIKATGEIRPTAIRENNAEVDDAPKAKTSFIRATDDAPQDQSLLEQETTEQKTEQETPGPKTSGQHLSAAGKGLGDAGRGLGAAVGGLGMAGYVGAGALASGTAKKVTGAAKYLTSYCFRGTDFGTGDVDDMAYGKKKGYGQRMQLAWHPIPAESAAEVAKGMGIDAGTPKEKDIKKWGMKKYGKAMYLKARDNYGTRDEPKAPSKGVKPPLEDDGCVQGLQAANCPFRKGCYCCRPNLGDDCERNMLPYSQCIQGSCQGGTCK